ncbi:enoyl-CoA hydratase/isomerase family protein [Microbulbifer flavimaris]|uniref:Enoyl-CoA hydratase/isomerase family protein n=1 Tax=Microbulbifer flavimaris TaxID=1781068 RepID=A0ABX4I0M4_9GAMM|nr:MULTISPECIES: enoyl-CoA hydratase/isomerase family protein [Microbulbifer]KUJ83774.1 enoyl-CoA hydratase [Microbulbifer sp. ZGT114]PCO05949.1 enoyl-CoA hydratase/isomerase family protein [Microbulbifer flavimaris]
MKNASVLYQLQDGVATITLNRPGRHNALVPVLLDELREALARCRQDCPGALVLRAEGRSFSSGGDVAAFYELARGERRAYARRLVGALNEAMLDLLRLPLPSLAAVHGMVTGGSAGLVLACDIAVAGPSTHFAPWYTAVGFSPDGGWSAMMPERIGRGRALDVQLTNRRIDAREALELGLVQYLEEDGDVSGKAMQLARRLRDVSGGSVRNTLALTRPDVNRVAPALEAELRHFLELIDGDEADRGMAAFLDRD